MTTNDNVLARFIKSSGESETLTFHPADRSFKWNGCTVWLPPQRSDPSSCFWPQRKYEAVQIFGPLGGGQHGCVLRLKARNEKEVTAHFLLPNDDNWPPEPIDQFRIDVPLGSGLFPEGVEVRISLTLSLSRSVMEENGVTYLRPFLMPTPMFVGKDNTQLNPYTGPLAKISRHYWTWGFSRSDQTIDRGIPVLRKLGFCGEGKSRGSGSMQFVARLEAEHAKETDGEGTTPAGRIRLVIARRLDRHQEATLAAAQGTDCPDNQSRGCRLPERGRVSLPVDGPSGCHRIDTGIELFAGWPDGSDFAKDLAEQHRHLWLSETTPWSAPDETPGADPDRFIRVHQIPQSRVLQGFNRSVAQPALAALRRGLDGDGPCFVPFFDLTASDGERDLEKDPGHVVYWLQRGNRVRELGIATEDQLPWSTLDLGSLNRQARLVLKRCSTESGEPLACAVGLEWGPTRGDEFWNLKLLPLNDSSPQQSCVLGALKLDFTAPSNEQKDRFRVAASPQPVRIGPPGRVETQEPWLRIEGYWDLAKVEPAGIDLAPRQRFADQQRQDDDVPWVLVGRLSETAPEDRSNRNRQPRLLLKVDERFRSGHTRSLSVELLNQGGPGPEIGVVVLDPNPLCVLRARFVFPPELPGSGADSRVFARWSTSDPDGPQWKLRQVMPDAVMHLPPQAVGEAYERRSDIPDSDAPIDFRLSPPARLAVRLRDDARSFGPLPWNLRLLFGQPGERLPGVALERADFELLYGLKTTLTPERVWLCSDEAQRGAIPKQLNAAESGVEPGYEKSWNRLMEAHRSRLLALLPYRGLQEEPPIFGAAKEIGFRLRLPPESDLAPDPYLDHQPDEGQVGLRGGATFGFESSNVWDAVKRDTAASSSELADLAFTALGGFGALTARFDQDRSAIQARVDLGRVSQYAVERIGRIGVFWNRAKHVIVYERTVARSQRYAPLRNGVNDEEQTSLAGRPIVRKIDEYVEILEPERRFEGAGDRADAVGFARGLRFGQRMIRVSSIWGMDVGDQGWKVPLWKPAPADLDGAEAEAHGVLFPRPQVALISRGEDGDDEGLLSIANPENLWFFTSTQPDTALDTDQWPAVEGVDFVPDRKESDGLSSPFGDRSREALQTALPPPHELPAHLAPCTWQFEPGGVPVNLLEGRGGQPVTARLRNFTLMREPLGALPATGRDDASREGAYRLLDRVQRVQRGVEGLADELDRLVARIREASKTGRTDLAERLKKDLVAKLDHYLPRDLINGLSLTDALFSKTPCELLKAEAGEAIDGVIANERRRVRELEAELTRALDEIRRDAGGSAAQLERLVEDARGRLRQSVGQARLPLDHIAGALNRAVGDVARLRRRLSDIDVSFRTQITGIRDRVKADAGALALLVEDARDRYLDTLQAAEDWLVVLDGLLVEFGSRVNGDGLRESLVALSELRLLLDSARREGLAVLKGVDLSEENVGTAIGAALTTAQGWFRQAESRLGVLAETLQSRAKELRDDVSGLQAMVAALPETLATHANNAIARLRKAVGGGIDRFESELAETVRALDNSITEVGKALKVRTDALIDQEICRFLPDQSLGQLLQNGRDALEEFHRRAGVWSPSRWQTELTKLRNTLRDSLAQAGELAQRTLNTVQGAARVADRTLLSLLRAFGAPPALPELSFNRNALTYRFRPGDGRIDFSPVTSFFSELGGQIKGLSLNLPSLGLDSRGLVPAELPDFDLSAVFNQLGGLQFDGLFKRLKLPRLDSRPIRVTHGFERADRRAWVQADVAVPYGSDAELYSGAGLAVSFLKPSFNARSRMEAGPDGIQRFSTRGWINTALRIEFGGTPFVDVRDVEIRFDDRGDFKVLIDPRRIDFKGGLRFLADLMGSNRNPASGSGFVVRLVEADGLPIGAESRLQMAAPPLNFGAFGLDGLVLALMIDLQARPSFKVGTDLSLGRPESPFMMTIGALSGGGWVLVQSDYYATDARGLEAMLSVGISVGRYFSIAFGPIRGSAMVLFGVEAQFFSRGGSGSFSLVVFFLLSGDASIWGFVHVSLYLRLSIEYQSRGGALTGRGVVRLTVKIGRWFKRSVNQRIEYRFAGGAEGMATSHAARLAPGTQGAELTPEKRACAFLAQFED